MDSSEGVICDCSTGGQGRATLLLSLVPSQKSTKVLPPQSLGLPSQSRHASSRVSMSPLPRTPRSENRRKTNRSRISKCHGCFPPVTRIFVPLCYSCTPQEYAEVRCRQSNGTKSKSGATGKVAGVARRFETENGESRTVRLPSEFVAMLRTCPQNKRAGRKALDSSARSSPTTASSRSWAVGGWVWCTRPRM